MARRSETAIGVAFAIAFATSAVAEGAVSTSGRMGMGAGRDGLAPFDALIQQYNNSGERFRIDTHCQSACTMFLSIRNVCVTPSAELLFHAGGSRGSINPASTAHMMSAYNGRLRRYLKAGGYMDTLAFHTVSGQDMISKFGYRACK
jgi:hypothetical protein